MTSGASSAVSRAAPCAHTFLNPSRTARSARLSSSKSRNIARSVEAGPGKAREVDRGVDSVGGAPMTDAWGDLVWAAISNLNARLILVGPGVLAMLTLAAVGLAGGWVIARIVRRVARVLAVDRRADAWGVTMALGRSGIRRAPSEVIALVVFWSIFIVFVTLGVEALAIPGTGRVTAFVLAGLPKIFGAAGILLVGWLVGNFLGEGVLIAAVNARVPEARLLARAVRWGILLFAAAMAVTHLGIGKEMVLVAFGITFGGLILTLSLAFGLGGRFLARQILDRYRRREPHPSETLTHL